MSIEGRRSWRGSVPPVGPDRWSAWADQVRARHERSAARRRRTLLVLLRRLAPVLLAVDRRRTSLQQIGPQIRLAIALFLQPPGSGPRSVRAPWPAVRLRGALRRTRTAEQVLLAPNRHRAGAASRETASAHGSAAHPSPAGPIARIVRRLHRSEDVQEIAQRLMPRGGRRVLSAAAGRDRIEMLEPHRRRRGQVLQRSPVPFQRPFADGSPHWPSENQGRLTAPPLRTGHPSAVMGATTVTSLPFTGANHAAPVNVEDLTERVVREIDRRIVAHRERMGRPY